MKNNKFLLRKEYKFVLSNKEALNFLSFTPKLLRNYILIEKLLVFTLIHLIFTITKVLF